MKSAWHLGLRRCKASWTRPWQLSCSSQTLLCRRLTLTPSQLPELLNAVDLWRVRLTLGRGFDFCLPSHRAAAQKLIRRKRPYVVILAFPCGPWSPLQYLNPAVVLDQRRAEGIVLISFAVQVAREQMEHNRHFLIENPVPSLGWKVDVLDELRQHPEVLQVVVDMCQFNLRAPDGGLHRKATQILTSMHAVVSIFMNHRCQGGHHHSPVLGGSKITAAAVHYTPEFPDTLIQGCSFVMMKHIMKPTSLSHQNKGALWIRRGLDAFFGMFFLIFSLQSIFHFLILNHLFSFFVFFQNVNGTH